MNLGKIQESAPGADALFNRKLETHCQAMRQRAVSYCIIKQIHVKLVHIFIWRKSVGRTSNTCSKGCLLKKF